MTPDYHELPEGVAAAFALVVDARARAADGAVRCEDCHKIDTMRFRDASARLTDAMLRTYAPLQARKRRAA